MDARAWARKARLWNSVFFSLRGGHCLFTAWQLLPALGDAHACACVRVLGQSLALEPVFMTAGMKAVLQSTASVASASTGAVTTSNPGAWVLFVVTSHGVCLYCHSS